MIDAKKIMVVDDERDMVSLIKDFLEVEGYTVYTAYDGKQAIEIFKLYKPNLVILDIMLPIIDGMEVCKIIRQQSTIPILMLSAKGSDIDKVLGLGLGADDYITKPFSPIELVARVKANLRRSIKYTNAVEDFHSSKFGNLAIDIKSHTVKLSDQIINLSAKEFNLLSFFMENPLQVFTRDQIYEKVWKYGDFGDIQAVTVYIRKLREKIEINPNKPQYIKTVWGVGYKFEGGLQCDLD